MLEAAFWGLAGASSLLIGAAIGVSFNLSERVIGFVLAFGAGTLISAVAFELTEEAFALGGADVVAGGLALGALTYFAGDYAIGRRGAHKRMCSHDREDDESSTALLLGAVLDGIPESAVIGITVLETGEVGVAILAAVFLSNLPEAISSSRGMHAQGLGVGHVMRTWLLVCAVAALSAGIGYVALESASDDVVGLIQAFAGGAVLTMLGSTMFPAAYRAELTAGSVAVRAIGLLTVLGFALAYLLSTLE